ncbi:MAG: symmetrical bis(5'-nucleosyl)-tetraphosphatase [Gammaproteobacteria bacterium]|jgi:bis(5'-nucleosyl)-tetraphosphatase (symmetrical)
MATYAIGDIQGCFASLETLLDKIDFNKEQDTLWFAGDLVNRGPDSLSTLRFVKALGNSAITVLGNHDLHLLAIAADHKNTRDKSLKKILKADDGPELIHWLRNRPLIHHDAELGFTMAHAGIYPKWNLSQALEYAEELHRVLQGDDYLEFIHNMYGNKPKKWKKKLSGWDRLRFIVNAFTRMRYCDTDGKLDFKKNSTPKVEASDIIPWFDVPERKMKSQRILFGHWSTLGLLKRTDVYALDTGCVWGGQLTALRIDLDEPCYISVDCPGDADPGDYL